MRRTGLVATAALVIALGGASAAAAASYPPGQGGGESTPAPTAPGLAKTGSDVGPLLALGGGALVVGSGAAFVARRRRQGT